MNDPSRKAKVSLEDLLRIKRAERPPAEFWETFQRGMRTKQLAAIVEPRPWWAPFIRVSARVSRYQLPVGAAAILAITFVTLREYRSAEMRPVYEPAVATASISPSIEATREAIAVRADIAEDPDVATVVPGRAVRSSTELSSVADQLAPAADLIGSSSHLVAATAEPTPSARYIAENFAAARADDPEVDQVLGRSIRTLDGHPQVEPLAQVNLPGESRRARLLGGATWLASASSSTDSALRTDVQSTRRLTERRLAESDAIRRIDVGGSRLTVKF
ncbi:MAG: hypothetical protein JWM88_855 [Verrucomicrobia bacterium]|nr:hypothetical protein [Verrucomicrobiota bacterium]